MGPLQKIFSSQIKFSSKRDFWGPEKYFFKKGYKGRRKYL